MCARTLELEKVIPGRSLLLLATLAGFLASTSAARAANYFPLGNENRWTYVAQDGSTRTAEVVVKSSTLASSRENFYVENYMFPFDPRPLRLFNSVPGQTMELFQDEIGPWYPWWRFDIPVEFPMAIPPFGDDCVHGTEGTFLGLTTVTVPAGVFAQAAVIVYNRYPCVDSAFLSEVLAPGVGLVQRRVRTPAGSETWSLHHAVVDGKTIGSSDFEPEERAAAPVGARAGAMSSATPSSWGAIKSVFGDGLGP